MADGMPVSPATLKIGDVIEPEDGVYYVVTGHLMGTGAKLTVQARVGGTTEAAELQFPPGQKVKLVTGVWP